MYTDEVIDLDERIDNIKTELINLTDGEEDPEKKQYNNYLIDSIDIIQEYIKLLENDHTAHTHCCKCQQ